VEDCELDVTSHLLCSLALHSTHEFADADGSVSHGLSEIPIHRRNQSLDSLGVFALQLMSLCRERVSLRFQFSAHLALWCVRIC